ncbi:monovalent cation:proton antiporter-2 (CPA2) family protein [Ancylobacter sp. GSK1Z-4-2]|uniref:Monovalent cation:proton antiporter-2 (CPA2) family protein n=1 Tax=Ancylobacter mangrovi TaxID=2972472 RepID=A0A9X2PAF7_9HYPH|nr:monovalent cation:proton antiporter-2 (CPA2) family protein [Ancylobacter mangrovi]MCS0495089.1 monovalent cation:proton antiporter-2 (CPA2) family protein [Ancylobacter mangrovi]MCS0502483.1 monovalent cation:proton antiporter-2 (CPA2) family protein [Ancylobacter mangrovi]
MTAVVAVPVARRLGLSPIVGYLLAGVAIGPSGIGVFHDPERIITVAEIGVVLLLFIIGLELQLSRLLALKRAIFGMGLAQLVFTGTAIAALTRFAGQDFDWRAALVAGLALSLSATSIALQLLEEKGGLSQPYGQRAFAVLLFQDMAVVPLIALMPLLTPGTHEAQTFEQGLGHVSIIVGALAIVILTGRYLLTPMFQVLARSGAREVMTAAALLVVLGAGALMASVGMSMAMGAFLAGVMLSESSFRHELEANVEAFRGLLVALFFMGVGMSMNLAVVLANAWLLIVGTLLVTLVKAVSVWTVFRLSEGTRADAVRSASVLTPAGEFSFVLFPLALGLGLITSRQSDMLAACAGMTMLLGPPIALFGERLARRLERSAVTQEPDEDFSDAHGSVLVVGFGRFGQIVSQCLLARGLDVTIIDNDVEMIQNAGRFGFRIYYGDGTRLEVLRAAGAERARVIAVCVDRRETSDRIIDILRSNIPAPQLFVRAYDRTHTLALRARGVDFEIRETFESALTFGEATLRASGLDAAAARATVNDVRERDLARLALQEAGGVDPGLTGVVEPEPLIPPEREAHPLNPEAEDVLKRETEFSG